MFLMENKEKKPKKEVLKKEELKSNEERDRRIIKELELLKPREVISPTALAKKVMGVHVHKLRDVLDFTDSVRKIPFEILRDKNKKIRGIIKLEEDFDIKKDINVIKKDILDIKNILDKIKWRA